MGVKRGLIILSRELLNEYIEAKGDIVSVQVIASDMITSFHQALCVLILSNM